MAVAVGTLSEEDFDRVLAESEAEAARDAEVARSVERPTFDVPKQAKDEAESADDFVRAVEDLLVAIAPRRGDHKPFTDRCIVCEKRGVHNAVVQRCDCPCHRVRAFLG